MRIVEIKARENGSHRNQTSDSIKIIPDGWAKVPDELETPNFPFGEVKAEVIGGVPTVTKWTPGTIPEPEPEPEQPVSEIEQLRADVDYIAIMAGVEL